MKRILFFGSLLALTLFYGNPVSVVAQNQTQQTTCCTATDTVSNKPYVVQGYDIVKDGTINAYDKTAQGVEKGYDIVKEGTVNAYDTVANGTVNAYDATKTGIVNASDSIAKGSVNVFDKTKEEFHKIF